MPTQLSSLAQFAQNGMRPIGQQNQNQNKNQNKDQNEWQRILSMLLASQKMDWGTMAGFGLGKLLRDYAINQRDKVVTRGNIKNQLFTSNDPKEIQDMLEAARKQGESYYQRLMSEGAERGLPWANLSTQTAPTGGNAQPDLSGINPDARALPRAREGILGNPAELFPQSNTPTLESLPVAEQPFAQSNYNLNEFEKYKSLAEAIRRMGWQR